MRPLLIAVALLVVTSNAAAALPKHGALVPGQSLGGIRLGETAAGVRDALGTRYGLCRGCATTTWYFTYRPFTRQGLAVEFTRGRVTAVWTIWKPPGWSASKGLKLGAVEAQVPALVKHIVPLVCSTYDVFTHDSGTARDAYYVANGELWGFGLLRRHANPCR